MVSTLMPVVYRLSDFFEFVDHVDHIRASANNAAKVASPGKPTCTAAAHERIAKNIGSAGSLVVKSFLIACSPISVY
jgi:hypothetical protein